MRGLNVLSVFDGMSCGMLALDKLDIPVNRYMASEIDKHATKVSDDNYPDIERLGDIRNIKAEDLPEIDLPEIDLLIGGSPCQGFSFAGKQMNFDDPRSKLFFEFVRLLSDLMPKYFILENVRMKKEYRDVISSYLGCEPIEINSSLVSAQNRKRLFWTNLPVDGLPEDKGILLKDVIHEYTDDPMETLKGRHATWMCENAELRIKKKYLAIDPDKALTMTARQYANWNGTFWFEALNEYVVPFEKTLYILDKEVERGKVGYFRKDSQANRVYYIHDKAVCLTGSSGGGAAKMGQYLVGSVRKIDTEEEDPLELVKTEASPLHLVRTEEGKRLRKDYEEGKVSHGYNEHRKRVKRKDGKANTLTTAPNHNHLLMESYLFGCITPDRVNKRQNGQRFSEGKKFYTLTAQDRHGILVEGYIRKLTPVECERLQNVPDGYTSAASNAQRYKMLGNGWTIDVICHLLKNIKI